MIIQKLSPFSGWNTMDLPVTEEQLRAWESGTLIQDAMPNLTDEQREFLISGMTPADWDKLFPPEKEGG